MDWLINHEKYEERFEKALLFKCEGKITKSLGLTFEGYLPNASVGSRCVVETRNDFGDIKQTQAEIVGFKDKKIVLMAFDDVSGIGVNSTVKLINREATVGVSDSLLGRVIDADGNPLDGKAPYQFVKELPIYASPVSPLEKEIIRKPLDLGVKSINGFITAGRGQRMGIMAGSGVGKSVLLGMMARYTKADVTVIGLIGERGREVKEFIENDIGKEGMKRSVLVVATAEKSPLLRMRGAFVAQTIAEYFADQGKSVLLMMDSITRFCMAQREIGLSMGEPPASRGYTPSVFSMIPKLLERAGTRKGGGSITGLYTVLVEGDDMDEPIADATRSVLDGHIVLDRKLAHRNHYPAVDIMSSASRVMKQVVSPQQFKAAGVLRELLAVYKDAEDLINVGAYVRGSNPKIDIAIKLNDEINKLLKQPIEENGDLDRTISVMHGLARQAEALNQK